MSGNTAPPRVYDISLPIETGLPVWPGDPDVLIEPDAIHHRDGFRTSKLSFGSHIGTHVDAPCHYLPHGLRLDEIPVEHWSGQCHVAHVADHIDVINASHLECCGMPEGTTHLLLRTRNSTQWDRPRPWAFEPTFVGIDTSAAQWIVDRDVRLVGIDYFGIAPFDEPDHETHLTLLRENVLILEGLDLRAVAAGAYWLTCLPMRVMCGDGAPARAILTSIP